MSKTDNRKIHLRLVHLSVNKYFETSFSIGEGGRVREEQDEEKILNKI